MICEDLVNAGALVSIANKDNDTPLDKAKAGLSKRLQDLAERNGHDIKKISFKEQSWLGTKTRSRDATLSRFKGINLGELDLHTKIASTPSGETWRGRWQKNDVIAKVRWSKQSMKQLDWQLFFFFLILQILAVRQCTARISRDFNEEFPKLRIFSHPNILPIIGACNQPPNLITISQVSAVVLGFFVFFFGIIFEMPASSYIISFIIHAVFFLIHTYLF